ncbi:MAG: cell division protein FtsQ/DivIB [Pseudomonadota bacterium]
MSEARSGEHRGDRPASAARPHPQAPKSASGAPRAAEGVVHQAAAAAELRADARADFESGVGAARAARRGAGGFSALDDTVRPREAGGAGQAARRGSDPSEAQPLEESLGLSGQQGFRIIGSGVGAVGRLFRGTERLIFGAGGLAGALGRLERRLAWLGAGRGAAFWLGGAAIAAGLLALPPVQSAMTEAFERMRAAALAHPEFAIQRLEVTGAVQLSDETLKAAIAPPEAERAALAFDYNGARARLEALGWVERASVVLKPPHTLAVEIVERRPAALWRRGGKLAVIDAGGVVTEPAVRRGDHPSLPLLVGPGAQGAVEEALRLHAAAVEGGLKVAALTRIGERRWDLELIGGPRVMLPERDPQRALARAVLWAQSADLLERGYEVLDLRLDFAPTARGGAGPTL